MFLWCLSVCLCISVCVSVCVSVSEANVSLDFGVKVFLFFVREARGRVCGHAVMRESVWTQWNSQFIFFITIFLADICLSGVLSCAFVMLVCVKRINMVPQVAG